MANYKHFPDFFFQVAVRNAKSLELRIGGSVETPDIDISVVDNIHFIVSYFKIKR